MTEELRQNHLRDAELDTDSVIDPFGRRDDTRGLELDGPHDIVPLLREATKVAADLLGRGGRPPTALHVRAGSVSIDLSWREPAPRTHAPVAPAVPDAVAPVPGPSADPAGHVVSAPTVGVFYRSASPGAEPFVTEGATVTAGQQIGIVEAMKLMIPVECDRGGTVREILVGDGEPVEFGTPLLTVDPAGPSRPGSSGAA
ncbi:acetyl-CoA carboxylase biotin carboxyl carrier protein [Amycolatopsis regifaucium]|uniref:Biotin carboxyl carrier protein of acetyl-CoA carboxylase n=1 Tax=Amycolatopsis regifaucium TaxID=546365 RepID=A0A154MVP3_9PSEU|nr:biotin/lipoyl-containing protein [Amycolatopsis regifaucium]KZB88352.1 acetyl-CoA carboxylase biotin carboxyl carrier protein subunit [Amycolatopsis regifaucium]OKA11463.1 acetyl-CoA carboxylase biotin carboxyl carrier protein subunit [Amycolatopsis regifaucium]SFH41169.1 acetyl-CoA carboxylase biotin carboxyl carrier protein [Amycolatopsis regifaucium]